MMSSTFVARQNLSENCMDTDSNHSHWSENGGEIWSDLLRQLLDSYWLI